MREWAAVSHCRFEPDNEYGWEAIRAELPGLGQVGYGADSPRTAPDESMRAAACTTAWAMKPKARCCAFCPAACFAG